MTIREDQLAASTGILLKTIAEVMRTQNLPAPISISLTVNPPHSWDAVQLHSVYALDRWARSPWWSTLVSDGHVRVPDEVWPPGHPAAGGVFVAETDDDGVRYTSGQATLFSGARSLVLVAFEYHKAWRAS